MRQKPRKYLYNFEVQIKVLREEVERLTKELEIAEREKNYYMLKLMREHDGVI